MERTYRQLDFETCYIMKKVSVIIPVYNAEKYIRQCINSVLLQDYPNIEIIVINDGSTDKSFEILYELRDQITLIDQPNGGISVARNAGINAATGDYIAFLDADDIWLAGKITAQVDFMENNPDFGAICTDHVHWIEYDRGPLDVSYDFSQLDRPMNFVFSGWVLAQMMRQCSMLTITVMLRKTVLDTIGLFDTEMKIDEDFDLWVRIAQQFKIHKLDKVFAVYRMNKESITHNTNYTGNICKIIERLMLNITDDALTNNRIVHSDIRLLLSNEYADAALEYVWINEVKKSISALIMAFRVNPYNPWIYHFINDHAWKWIPKSILNLTK